MPNFTPVWTDNVTILASQTLAINTSVNGSFDLRTKIGAYLFIRLGRLGTTALTNGVDVRVRRTLNNNAVFHPGPSVALLSSIATATSTTVDATSAAGQKVLNVTTTTNFVVGDILLIGGATAREEWARISRITNPGASGELVLDRNLTYEHAVGDADPVTNKADVWAPVWIQGGATYEIVFDYGDDTAGASVQIECKAQTYDSDLYTA